MARSDTRFREAYNLLLDAFASAATAATAAVLPSESTLAKQAGVSRTVVRAALQRMEAAGIVARNGRHKSVLRPPRAEDRLTPIDEAPALADLERAFLDWILRFDVPAGTPLNVAEMSRRFAVTPHAFQEFLASLGGYGLVERRARGGWLLLGFTADFAVELSEFRAVLELDAVRQVLACPVGHDIWPALEALRLDHLDLQRRIETDYHDFSTLDERFHLTITSVVRNRFVVPFRRLISLIFHYHYMWDKRDEKTRNAAAIREHLAVIDALQLRDEPAALDAARRHLRTSTTTLLSSLRDHQLV